MDRISGISLPKLGQRHPTLQELQTFLKLIPHAALVISIRNGSILSANEQAARLLGTSPGKLKKLTVHDLFMDLSENDLKDWIHQRTESPDSPVRKLITHDQTPINARLLPASLSSEGDRLILTIESAVEPDATSREQNLPDRLWTFFLDLTAAYQQPDLCTAFSTVFRAGKAMSEADLFAVYKAGEDQPALRKIFGTDENNLFPSALPAKDLFHLQSFSLWTPGKRTASALQRIAQAAQLSFLASHPLGQPNAAIGLLVLGDQRTSPPPQMQYICALLAFTLTNLIQYFNVKANSEKTTLEARQNLRIEEIIEDSIQEGLLILSLDLKILRINRSAAAILGYNKREIQGEPIEKILIGSEKLIPALKAALEGQPTYLLDDLHLFRRDGEAFPAKIRILPINPETKPRGVFILLQDLSEQEMIREQTQQLEQRAMLGEVTAVFAHEVRNPINNISTGLELMAISLPADDPNQDNIRRLQQDCDRLSELMKSVLAFSKPADYAMEPLDVTLLVHRLLDRLRPRMNRNRVVDLIQADPDCPPVRGNPRALEQVFSNLIQNALQAMSETGGQLSIRIQPVGKSAGRSESLEPSHVQVSIADTGPGIPVEIQDRIFQPFFTTRRDGTGLGLAIAKRIVTAHKGTISLESIPGATVFHVRLPVYHQQYQE